MKPFQPEPNEILCRTAAAYGQCKLEKKGLAIKCRNHWQHIPTSHFIDAINNRE